VSDPHLKSQMSTSNPRDISDSYDRWAASYDADQNKTRDMAAIALRKSELQLEGRQLLEIGCGTGVNTEWLIKCGGAVTAVDFSEEMLRLARARVHSPNARFLKHDIRSVWPFDDRSFDVVVAMLVLEHIESLGPVFEEATRVIRPGGMFFFSELHPARQHAGRQAEFVSPGTAKPERITAFLHDVSEYLNAGLAAGFELVSVGEWRDDSAHRSDRPRVLSVVLGAKPF